MKFKPINSLLFIAIVIIAMGVTDLDFKNLISWHNIRPVVLIVAGIVSAIIIKKSLKTE